MYWILLYVHVCCAMAAIAFCITDEEFPDADYITGWQAVHYYGAAFVLFFFIWPFIWAIRFRR